MTTRGVAEGPRSYRLWVGWTLTSFFRRSMAKRGRTTASGPESSSGREVGCGAVRFCVLGLYAVFFVCLRSGGCLVCWHVEYLCSSVIPGSQTNAVWMLEDASARTQSRLFWYSSDFRIGSRLIPFD